MVVVCGLFGCRVVLHKSVRSWDQPLSWLVCLPGLQSRGRQTATNGDRSRKLETAVYLPWRLVPGGGVWLVVSVQLSGAAR